MTALCRSIFTRHRIRADRVLAHSDVAPARKRDPGEKFPWMVLAGSGVGLWVKPSPIRPAEPFFDVGRDQRRHREDANVAGEFGYGVPAGGYLDRTTRDVVDRLSAPFSPTRVDGIVDGSTLATLKALVAARDAWLSANQTS